jgi:CshA-type fibril repeat protein
VTNQGTYTVNTSTGIITFTPTATFTGTATPVSYQVTDQYALSSGSTYTPTVYAVGSGVPDTSVGAQGAAQQINPLANDVPATGANFVVTTVLLCATGQVSPNCNATSVTVAGGTYTVNTANGVVTFTPTASFTGTAPAVTYQVTDTTNATVSTTITPTVVPTPVATPDTSTGVFNTAQSVNPVTNDTTATNYPIVANTVRLCGTGQTAPNCTSTSVNVP